MLKTGPATGLRLKRIYDLPDAADGARVLVDRLWPRGVRKADAHLTLWLKEIAPSPALRKWFGHDPARFDAFAQRYRRELDEHGAVAVNELLTLLAEGPVTALYAAHDAVHNHARVLADYLKDRPPQR